MINIINSQDWENDSFWEMVMEGHKFFFWHSPEKMSGRSYLIDRNTNETDFKRSH